MPLPLDTTPEEGELHHIDQHEVIATTLNGLANLDDGVIVTWDDDTQTFSSTNVEALADDAAFSDKYVAVTDETVSGFAFVVDEDDMASDSDTLVPTQQSVKAYVDSLVSPEVISDAVLAAVTAGDNITVTPDDEAGTVEIAVSGLEAEDISDFDSAALSATAGAYDAAGTAASAVASHEADTTNVHGIADTTALVTTSTVAELAQDAVGGILTDGTTIDFTYNDGTPSITAEVKDGSLSAAKLSFDVATQSELDAHASDTTSVHGIADTTKLVVDDDLHAVATSGDYDDLENKPTLGTAAAADTEDFATAAQGALADTAVQPADLGTAAAEDVEAFASAAQGALADTAVQPDDLHVVATSGDYSDLANTPTLGTAAAADTDDFDAAGSAAAAQAHAVQRSNHTGTQLASTISDFAEAVDDRVSALLVAGDNVTLTYDDDSNTLTIDAAGGSGGGPAAAADVSVDTAGFDNAEGDDVQEVLGEFDAAITALESAGVADGDKGDIVVSSSGTVWSVKSGAVAYSELSGTPTLGTAASADTEDFASAAQGALADTAVQPGDLHAVATSGDYTDLDNTPTLGTAAAADTDDFDAAGSASAAQAYAVQRSNHTGTQAMSTIDGLETALNGKQPLDSDLTTIAAANNGSVLAATTASFTSTLKTKLDNIEANADVTDETNVRAAGGVIGDGITDIVKLSQSEYDGLGSPDANTLYVIVG